MSKAQFELMCEIFLSILASRDINETNKSKARESFNTMKELYQDAEPAQRSDIVNLFLVSIFFGDNKLSTRNSSSNHFVTDLTDLLSNDRVQTALNDYITCFKEVKRSRRTEIYYSNKAESKILTGIFTDYVEKIKMQELLNEFYTKLGKLGLTYESLITFKYIIAAIKSQTIDIPQLKSTTKLKSKLILTDLSYSFALILLSVAVLSYTLLTIATGLVTLAISFSPAMYAAPATGVLTIGLMYKFNSVLSCFNKLHTFYRQIRDPLASEILLTEKTNDFLQKFYPEQDTSHEMDDSPKDSFWNKFTGCFFRTQPIETDEEDEQTLLAENNPPL